MKRLGILLSVVIILTGCSGGEEKTTICKMDEEMVRQEVTLTSKGDEVTKQKIITEVELSLFGDEYTEEELKEMYEEMAKASYEGVKGVTYDVEVKDGKAKQTITIDYEKADMEELVESMLVLEVDGKTPNKISLEEAIKEVEDLDGTCKEQ